MTRTCKSCGATEIGIDYTSSYTPWRRFLASLGLALLALVALALLTFVVWGNHYINMNLPPNAL